MTKHTVKHTTKHHKHASHALKKGHKFSKHYLIVFALFIAILGGIYAYSSTFALSRPYYDHGVKYHKMSHVKRFRSWRMAPMIDLRTGRRIGNYRPLTKIEVNRLAYRKGYFYYIQTKHSKKNKLYGVLISNFYQINKRGQIISPGGRVLPSRNYMPLSQHVAPGGSCTAARKWYTNMNNNMVAAIQ